jgi:F-box interacting protein
MVHLWNPSIRKFKELPFLEKPQHRFRRSVIMTMYGFGFDPVSDNYKVVVVLPEFDDIIGHRNVLKVHTLGTDSWKTISVFSFADNCIQRQGKYVSGTINWLVSVDIDQGQCSIASIDLRNECYQEILLPNYFKLNLYMHLSVFRNCLCLIYGEDVWVMKEYGNKESWTRLFTISNMRDSLTPSYPYIRAEYVFEDQVLIDTIDPESIEQKYICYNFRNGTSKLIEFEKTLEVCVESLISSCF